MAAPYAVRVFSGQSLMSLRLTRKLWKGGPAAPRVLKKRWHRRLACAGRRNFRNFSQLERSSESLVREQEEPGREAISIFLLFPQRLKIDFPQKLLISCFPGLPQDRRAGKRSTSRLSHHSISRRRTSSSTAFLAPPGTGRDACAIWGMPAPPGRSVPALSATARAPVQNSTIPVAT